MFACASGGKVKVERFPKMLFDSGLDDCYLLEEGGLTL